VQWLGTGWVRPSQFRSCGRHALNRKVAQKIAVAVPIQVRILADMRLKMTLWVTMILLASLPIAAESKRKIIIDQDARGPATTDQQSMMVLLNSPQVEALGITIVSGDQWRDEEVAHTLRMLEVIGRADVPVYSGAVFPLINRLETIERWESLYGKVAYKGAWNRAAAGDGIRGTFHGPYEVPNIVEGNPTTKAADEDAAHFITRMVHKYPHEVTIYAGGPLTNLAQAVSLDPKVADLAQELVIMGGSIAPVVPTDWQTENRREFNFWWDPEAVHMVLTSPWHKITITTVDISVKTRLTRAMIAEIAKSPAPSAQYIGKYADEEYLWDELAAAAWLDPSIITKETPLYMDIDISHTGGYGNVLVWAPGSEPGLGEQLVHVQQDLDKEKFYRMFAELDVPARPRNN
jgi:purine nucleosidase